MVKIWKLHWIAHEKDWGIIADQIPVTFFGVKLHRKATNVSLSIRSTTLTCHRGKTGKQVGFFTHLGKNLGARVFANIVGDSEGAVSARTLSVHAPLRNHFSIEVSKLFQKPDVLQ